MTERADYACHGLGVIQPIDLVAEELNRELRTNFQIVGGIDPRIEQRAIEYRMAADHRSGCSFIWIGHSLGAALGYYLAQEHPDWKFRLVVTVDPTDWGSNIDSEPWVTRPKHPGRWRASSNAERWLNIHSSSYPGGGILDNPGKTATDHHFPQLPHIGIILDPRVKKLISDAVRTACT